MLPQASSYLISLPISRYITQESHKLEIQARPPMAVTNAVSWRSEGIRYRKNEVFLDVVESVNLLVNANGNVIRSEILGAVKMKCYLSGMPELRLGLNDKVMFENTGRAARGKAIEMEDVKFHQCVRLSRFENDRTISFIPPDGEFELMSYRLSTQVKPLIWAEAVIERHEGSRIEFMVKVGLLLRVGHRVVMLIYLSSSTKPSAKHNSSEGLLPTTSKSTFPCQRMPTHQSFGRLLALYTTLQRSRQWSGRSSSLAGEESIS